VGANYLYLNLGDGTFADVSTAAGVDDQGSTESSAVFDDGAGDLVLYVANDRYCENGRTGGDLSRYLPDGWYQLAAIDDQGVPSFAKLDRGVDACRSSMGIAVTDLDENGLADLYVTDIGKKWLYLDEALDAPLVESAARWNVGVPGDVTTLYISWSPRFLDLDRDGARELMIVNGSFGAAAQCPDYHQLDRFMREPAMGQPFIDETNTVGLPVNPICFNLGVAYSGRGLAVGDVDGDGDDDLVVTPYDEQFRLYRNDTPSRNHALRLRLVGTVSAPDPVGAVVTALLADGSRRHAFRYAGGDTYSQSDSVVEIGLGGSPSISEVRVRWPSGLDERIDTRPEFALDREIRLVEPAWLTVQPRVVDPAGAATLVYAPVDDRGDPLGVIGAGRAVTIARSDGVPVTVTDVGDGTYTATLPHPGVSRRTTLTITDDGIDLVPRPMLNFR
jgi:hypothetical protein